MIIFKIILWFSAGMVIYTYGLYPAIVFLLSKFRKGSRPRLYREDLPTVSMIISVYNEEAVLDEKFKNISALDYPGDKIEFIFGSDGSTDRTNEILSRAASPGVKVHLFGLRSGKANVINQLVQKAKGEIIVFSDANTIYDPETVKKLVAPFGDQLVGGVCGELRLLINKKSVGEIGETSYWQYESVLKRLESDYQTVLGATGGVYAIRRSLFKPLPASKAVVDDFLIPIEVVRRGFRVVYEPSAIAFEEAAGTVTGEFRRKVRIGASNINGIPEFADLLNPMKGFVAFALWSHKIIRWLAPIFLLAILILSLPLSSGSGFYAWFFGIQLFFLLLGLIGFLFETRKISLGVFGFPYYFIAMNLALFIGLIKSVVGRQSPTWSVVR